MAVSMPAKTRARTPAAVKSEAPDENGLVDQLVAAWAVNNRLNLMLLDHITDDGLKATLSARGGRTVGRQLAHMHMVRVGWLENSRGRGLVAGVTRFDSKAEPGRAELKKAFAASGDAVAAFLRDQMTGPRRPASVRGGVGVWFGYLLAHEGHHRGSMLLTLKQTGHALDESMRWGIWAWDKI